MEVRPESHVAQIEHDASGKVTGVTYFDADGKLQRQKARIVAVAGNSLESPRLLLNSASSKFPDGLANSSGQVGRNYMRHTTGSVYAIFEQPVHMYRGTTMAGIMRDEARNDPSRGFVGGYELETLSLGLPFMAAFLNPGAWGREFATAIDGYSNMAGMWIVGEDMPQETNRITLSDQKDKWGLPVVDVHFDDHPNDIAMRNHAYGQGKAMYEAVGATRTFPTPPYPSTHNLGTNRMSANRARRRGQQSGPDARHQESVHLGRQPVHDRRGREPDADDRDPGDPSGRLHRRSDEVEHDLRRRKPPEAGTAAAGTAQREGPFRVLNAVSCSQWSGGFGAHSGPSRGDPCTRASRPIATYRARSVMSAPRQFETSLKRLKCAIGGHSSRARRTHQIDPKPKFLVTWWRWAPGGNSRPSKKRSFDLGPP